MSLPPDLPGLSYDLAHARSIADGCSGVLRAATSLGATPNDQLAALAILAARVIRASHLTRNPGVGAAAISSMTLEVIAQGDASGLFP